MNEKVLEILRSPYFLNELVKRTEIGFSKTFWRLCERKRTLRYILDKDTKGSNTNSVRVSVCFGENFEEEMIPTLKSFNIENAVHIDNQFGDFKIGDHIWELKTSKVNPNTNDNKTMQGSTHSGSKCNSYIFIRYDIDIDKVFKYKTKPNYIINGLHFSVHKDIVKQEYWKGTGSSNNSRTTLRVHKDNCKDFQEGLIFGKIKPAAKWTHFLTEPFNLKEYEKRVNSLPDIMEI
jgi:hypothetical protein